MEQEFSSREVSEILGISPGSLNKAVYNGIVVPPAKDRSGRYRWSRLDAHRAAWAMSRQRNYDAWEAANPPPKQLKQAEAAASRRSVLA